MRYGAYRRGPLGARLPFDTSHLGDEVVPDVDGPLPLGAATIYACLFSEVWGWVALQPRSPADVAAEHAADALRAARLERIATALSAAMPARMDRAHLNTLAELVAGLAELMAGVEDTTEDPATSRGAIAAVLARSELPLHETAWQWILREEDRDLLRFLTALVTHSAGGAGADALPALLAAWRALLEDRALCRAAAAAIHAELRLAAPPTDT
jgi:hypothetical protein